MTRYALSLLSLVGLLAVPRASAAAEPAADAPSIAAPLTLWSGPTWEAVAIGDLVFALEEDFLHVVALDLGRARVRWRSAFQDKANGYHRLLAVEGRLFVHAGPTLVELDPRTGRALRRGAVAHNRLECHLSVRGPQAALSCDSGLWLVGLDPVGLGPYLPTSEVHFYDDLGSGEHSTHYLRSASFLVGRTGGLAIVAHEDRDAPREGSVFSVTAALFGLDPATGARRWRTPELVTSGLTAAGLTADGATAWVLSETTRAVGAVDAQTGALRWKVAPTDASRPFNADVCADGRTAVVLVDDRVEARDLVGGAVAWTKPAGGALRVVAYGGSAAPLGYGGEKPYRVAAASCDGRVDVLEVGADGAVLRSPEGGLLLAAGGQVTAVAAAGTLAAPVPGPEGGTFTVAGDALGGFVGGQEAVFRRQDGARLGGFPSGVHPIATIGTVWAVVTPGASRERPMTLHLLRVGPSEAAPRRTGR